MYMPRALWLAPVVALAILAGLARRFVLWPTHVALALLVAWPLMGLHLPFARWLGQVPESGQGQAVRVLTLNVGPTPLDEGALIDLLEREKIDIACFQESEHRTLPRLGIYLAVGGWHVNSKRTIASRFPIREDLRRVEHPWKEGSFWGPQVDLARVELPGGQPLDVVSAHLPTIRFGLDRLRAGDPAGLQAHVDWRREQVRRMLGTARPEPGVPRVLGGDLNAPGDSILLDPLRSFFLFAFDRAGLGYGYTRPACWSFLDIDHILCTPEIIPMSCRVGPDVGSDHLPVVAEFQLPELPAKPR
jgi:endonuclease/exonuclease/phosphatase (EEP) superfamily protein YafD